MLMNGKSCLIPLLKDNFCEFSIKSLRGARWLSGSTSDSGARGWRLETYLNHVVSLSKTLYSPKVLVIPRKGRPRPNMTEKLLTGSLSLNTNKQIKILAGAHCIFKNQDIFYGEISKVIL